MSQAVIICEGYHDRAFWKGLLEHHGYVSFERGGTQPDPWGDPVRGAGQYGFTGLAEAFARLAPAGGGWSAITRLARSFVRDASRRPLRHLVLCRDADLPAGQPVIYPEPASIADALRAEVTAVPDDPPGALQLSDGTPVSVVMWHTNDPEAPGLPSEQTLERLACAALLAAYPDRGPAVANWLASRPNPPEATPKEFAWSHMAGWYPEYGCEAFYSQLWEDPLVLPHLRSRLESCGAWRIATLLAQQ